MCIYIYVYRYNPIKEAPGAGKLLIGHAPRDLDGDVWLGAQGLVQPPDTSARILRELYAGHGNKNHSPPKAVPVSKDLVRVSYYPAGALPSKPMSGVLFARCLLVRSSV